LNLCWM